MKKGESRQFAELMAGLAEVFDEGKGLSSAKVEIYFQALEGFTIQQVKAAVSRMIQTRTFATFPKPGEIIDAFRGNVGDRALIAWMIDEKAIRHVGPYRSVKFHDAVIHSVIDSLGGWSAFQDFRVSEWVWRQKEFLTRYPSAHEGR